MKPTIDVKIPPKYIESFIIHSQVGVATRWLYKTFEIGFSGELPLGHYFLNWTHMLTYEYLRAKADKREL